MATSTSDTEIQELSEQELKAAIKSAWKKHEELAKADMAPLLYWLRERLRAQGSRNDLHDKDRGFVVATPRYGKVAGESGTSSLVPNVISG